jgi:hypothetical protein
MIDISVRQNDRIDGRWVEAEGAIDAVGIFAAALVEAALEQQLSTIDGQKML